MTISDLLYYCVDTGLLFVEVYSIEEGGVIWSGDGDEVPDEIAEMEVGSWDIPNGVVFTINVD